MSFGQAIALLSFILSMGTIALTYWVAALQGTAEICNPFITGCTDITHTGMKGDAGFVFRGGMILATGFFIIWWYLMRCWLKPWSGKMALNSMQFFGTLAALGLLVGTSVLLPEKDDTHWSLHVQAANLFFKGMLVALMINYVLVFKARKQGLPVPSFVFKSVIMAGLLLVFLLFAGVTIEIDTSERVSIAEWWATLLIGCYFLSAFWDWENIGISLQEKK